MPSFFGLCVLTIEKKIEIFVFIEMSPIGCCAKWVLSIIDHIHMNHLMIKWAESGISRTIKQSKFPNSTALHFSLEMLQSFSNKWSRDMFLRKANRVIYCSYFVIKRKHVIVISNLSLVLLVWILYFDSKQPQLNLLIQIWNRELMLFNSSFKLCDYFIQFCWQIQCLIALSIWFFIIL